MQYSEITTQFLLDNYLFGIPLMDMYGNPMQQPMFQHYLNAAIQYCQRTFQIQIEPTTINNELHDYYAGDYNNWAFLQLFKRPILSVQSLEMWYGNQKAFDVPSGWIQTREIVGQLQLFPVSGETGSMVLTQNGSFMPILVGSFSYAPGMWNVNYTAGMNDVPEDLVEYIMKRASVGILQVWGDLIIGAGIANQTLSIDGLSQSIGTTQSPEFSGAGARIKNYQDDMKILEQKLKDTYVGINLGIL